MRATRLAIAAMLAACACAAGAEPPFELPPIAPGAGQAPLPEGDQVGQVRSVRFEGNTVIPTAELDKVAALFLARPLDLAAREQLRLALTQRYIDAGYVNSGALAGSVHGDVLVFAIVEGRLGAVRVRGMDGLRERYLLARLAADQAAPFNMDALRSRFALLLGDPLFARLSARVVPGARQGEAVLDVDVVRARAFELSAYVNNYRPPSIGAGAAGLKGTLRNLTGWGDALDASVQRATGSASSPRAAVGWTFPFSRASALSLHWEHGQSSVIEEPLRVLDIDSVLDSREIGISHILSESLTRKVALGLSAGQRSNRTTLAGEPFSFTPGEPDGRTRVRTLRFWQEAVMRSPRQVVALRSTFGATRNNTGNVDGFPAGAVPLPARRARVWQGQAQLARQVTDNGAQVVVRTSVQWTGRTLVALDRMAIGGIGTVRGYRENQLIRDRGAVINLEFDYPLLSRGAHGANLAVIPFIDAARAGNVGEASASVSSAGVAARLRWRALSVDLALARRLSHSAQLGPTGHTPQERGVHAQLSYRIF